MANIQTSIIQALFKPSITGNLGTIAPQIQFTPASLANGTAVNQADLAHVKERTVTTGTPDDIDLNGGGLLDPMGQPFNPAKIVAMCYFNRSATVAERVTVGGSGNSFNTWLTGTNAGIILGPGGMFLLIDPSLAAYGVTAGTGDIARVTVASGTAVPYTNGFFGRSV